MFTGSSNNIFNSFKRPGKRIIRIYVYDIHIGKIVYIDSKDKEEIRELVLYNQGLPEYLRKLNKKEI